MKNERVLTIHLAAPRGFCAGVDRAIQIVEEALIKFGAPVYVRHEIVHNKYVVDGLRDKGAVFVDTLDEVPDGVPVIFSAHGVPKSVPAKAAARGLTHIDATCPLVSKVHREAERHHREGNRIILIGHAGHPEVIGTMGQLPDGAVILIENESQALTIDLPEGTPCGYVTQTTLSVDDTAGIVAALKERLPQIQAPGKDDICYATTNRQNAVKSIAEKCDMIMVLGAPNSSNSKRLVEVASRNGCKKSMLVQRASDIDWTAFDGVDHLGLSAGASAPEILVEEVIDACREHFTVQIEFDTVTEERTRFKLPAELAS